MFPLHLNTCLTNPDVLIIGGGAAGIAAAVGAAQGGTSVVLLEKNAFLGGKATAAYVGTVCGLYYRSENPEARYIARGFPEIFATQLQERSCSKPFFYKNGLHFLPYDRFAFMQLCDEYAHKHASSLCLHSHLYGAVREENRIVALNALVSSQCLTFYPKVVVDASGDTTLAQILNLDSIQSDEYQASAQTFLLAGLPTTDAQTLNLSLLRAIQKGIESGSLPKEYERVSIVPGTVHNGQALFKLGIPLSIDNNPAQITHVELFARQAIRDILLFLQSGSDLFKNAWLAMMAPEAGVRTGPRHLGRYVLNEKDVLNCRKWHDAVARGAWPIEHWEPGKNVHMNWFAQDDYYDIPARALRSSQLDNLYFAGRNISATDQAIASARVIGTCLATGYAAGRLAAGQILNQSSETSVALIRQSLFPDNLPS